MALLSIGSDMECFVRNKKKEYKAICGLVGGTKEEPLQIPHLSKGFTLQEDNVALEFNIPICYTKKEFVGAFKIMRKEISTLLKELSLKIAPSCAVSFAEEELQHPHALIFGCEPDYNAWTASENDFPERKDMNLRTSGGHIHVGSDIPMLHGIKLMDLFLGVPSIILDDNPASAMRRELYGKAGAMRPKIYGWEYRTLSNFWMFNNLLCEWVYDQTKLICSMEKEMPEDFLDTYREKIETCINTGNKDIAKELITQFNIKMPLMEV